VNYTQNIKICLTIAVSLIVVAFTASATTIIVEEPEEIVKKAPFIVQGQVKNVEEKQRPNSSRTYANVTLKVTEVLKGSVPSEITIRRWELNLDCVPTICDRIRDRM